MKTRHLFKTLFVGVAMSILLPLAVNAQPIPIDEEHFPDVIFRNYLLDQRYGIDRLLTEEEISEITIMVIPSETYIICSLQGIEYFTELTILSCPYHSLTSLDVSKNTKLKELECGYNYLQTLDISGCTELENLYCYCNYLTDLDVSNNTALTFIQCDSNWLTTLDFSNNTALKDLNCLYNPLTTLNVSGCTELKSLNCYSSQLTSLNISGCTGLTSLNCSNNQLTSLDVSGCIGLASIDCSGNQLASLDVSKCTELSRLYCSRNQIGEEAMDMLISSLPQDSTSSSVLYVYNNTNSDEGNVFTNVQVAAAKEKGWTSYYYKNNLWTEYGDSDNSLDPVEDTKETTFSDTLDENTDLSDTVIDNTYYNMDADNGDGYDASEQAIVLNSTTTDEQMAAIEDANVGDDIISENFNGIIVEVPAGIGVVTVNVKTIGTHVLNVKIGNASPTKITKSERGTVDVAYNVTEPTYVYIYASTDEGSSVRLSRAASVGTNSVLLYGYKVTLGATGINLIQQPQSFDVYNLRGNMVRSDMTNLSGLSKGIYVVNGKKVVVK